MFPCACGLWQPPQRAWLCDSSRSSTPENAGFAVEHCFREKMKQISAFGTYPGGLWGDSCPRDGGELGR